MIPAAYSLFRISCSHELLRIFEVIDLHKASFNLLIFHPLLSECIKGPCPYPPVFCTVCLSDLQHSPRSVPEPPQMDNDIQRRGDLPLDRLERKIDPHHNHCLQPAEDIIRIVSMTVRHRGAVPDQHSRRHNIQRLLSSYLAYDDP